MNKLTLNESAKTQPMIFTYSAYSHTVLLVRRNRGVLVLLKFQVNSQKLGVQAPQKFEFE